MRPRVLFHHSDFDSTTSKKAKSRLLTPVPPKECGFGAGPQELEHDPHVQTVHKLTCQHLRKNSLS